MPDGIPWNALSPAEQATLRRLPERDQTPEFLRMWVCKEAVLKATGHGLRIPPDQVEVSGPGEKPALRRWPLDVPPESVTLHTLDPGHGYIGVAALLAGGEVVKVSEADAQLLSPERE